VTQAQTASSSRRDAAANDLEVLRTLFERLHQAGIRYCHWKSNEHLGPAMTGKTDVDVLVERRAAQALTRLLTDTDDFKRFVVRAGRGYPGIEDYVGFDRRTGTLSHLHVHYQLTLGEKFLKGHRLPWEELVLDTRVLDADHGVYVTDPHLEILILVARAAIKLRWRDYPLAMAGRRYFSGSMLRELRWLAAHMQADRLVEMTTPLVGGDAARMLPDMISGAGPSIGQLRAFHRRTQPRLSAYRMYSPLGTARRMWTREWTWIWWRLKNALLRAPTKSTRTPPQGGLTVAFVGPDGAGKSTLTTTCAQWLSGEVAVILAYGGSGVGTASAPRRWLQRVGKLVRRPSTTPRAGASTHPREASGLRKLGRALWVMALARERRRWARQVRRARSLSLVVLSDRLPQSQFAGLNDGPRLGDWLTGKSWWQRLAARSEQAAFRQAELVPPDVVIRLQVPADVAARRKPETPLDQLHRKIDVVSRLVFPAGTRVIDIDATQPLDAVRLQTQRAIWECL
jgi:thymidylate kinase